MEYIGPLIEAILWVGLLSAILIRFHNPIYGILSALQKRIEAGSKIKAGPFEISDKFTPQNPFQQKEKSEIEVKELIGNNIKEETTPNIENGIIRANLVQEKYYQAEDLVLRALQAEYGVLINRHLTAGEGLGFDGVFVTNGALNIIEVKYSRYMNVIPRYRKTLEIIISEINKLNWQRVNIILAIVYEDEKMKSSAEKLYENIVKDLPLPVTIKSYSFPELQSKFGI